MRDFVTSAVAPAAGALFLISLGMSAVHAATGPASGSVITLKGVQSSNCIGVKGSSTASGAALQSQGCSGSAFQQWKALADSSGYYQLVNAGSGQCMDVPSASAAAGTFIQQWGCGGGDWQKWQFHDDGAGHYYITSKASGLALDVYQHSAANGAAIDQWAYMGSANQQWIAGAGTSNALVGFGAGTTGGKGGSVTTVSSCSALRTALASTSAAIVRIPDNTTIDCRTSGTVAACPIACGASDPGKTYYRIPVGTQTCTELGSSSNATSTVPSYGTRIDVQSNKTLQGLGKNSKIVGASLNLANASNVIVSNLTIENINPHLVEGGDAFTLDSSRYIWIDHVTTRLISDGHVDMKNSQNVTLSWNHFDGYNTNVCGNQHHYTMLVENSKATLHHNFFDHASGRNPKLDGTNARAHLFNNYWLDITYFAINVNTGAQALVENNYFANSAKPHWNNGGYIRATGNVYTGISATDAYRNSGNTVFNDVTMYPYTLDGASGLPGSLATQTGPR
jgi:pectate lyase